MDRRHVLAAGIASLVAGCGGANPGDFRNAETDWPPEGDLIPTPLGRIHAWDKGNGTPVILIHGASGNLRDFTWKIGPEIAQSRRAIAMDRPGMGYSDRVEPNGGDPAVQARALMAAANEMGLKNPVLLGHSWGAAVATSWAMQDQDNVKGVVTVSGTVMPWFEKKSFAELVGLDRLLINTYFNYLQSSAARDGINRFVERIFSPQEPPTGYTDHVGGELAMRPASLKANKEDIAAINKALVRLSRDYDQLKVPFEVISGTDDFIIDADRQPIPFAEKLPNARLTLLEGIGHMPHHVAPEAIFAALDRLDPEGATAKAT